MSETVHGGEHHSFHMKFLAVQNCVAILNVSKRWLNETFQQN